MDAAHDRKLTGYRHAPSSSYDDVSSEKTASIRAPRASRWHTVERRDTWCLLMHVGLVLVHIALLIVAIGGWAGHISIALGKGSDRVQTALTIGGSVFGTVSTSVLPRHRRLSDCVKAYTSLLVMYTQRVALRRDLLQPQSLTSLHDRTAAWLGVGSALNIVRKQRRAFSRTLVTAVYLLCIFGLHNTIPALFSLVTEANMQPKNATIVEMTLPKRASAQ
jgi:hypothetical protein